MFNAEQWAGDPVGIKDGWNVAEIDEVLQKVSSTGNTYVSVRFSMPGGKIWENLNVLHPRDEVKEIAYKILANICLASGLRSIKDPTNPEELQGRKLRVLVGMEKNGDRQKIKAFEPAQQSAAPAQPVAAAIDRLNAPSAPKSDFIDDDIPF